MPRIRHRIAQRVRRAVDLDVRVEVFPVQLRAHALLEFFQYCQVHGQGLDLSLESSERRGPCDLCSPHGPGPVFKDTVFEILKEAPFEQRPASWTELGYDRGDIPE